LYPISTAERLIVIIIMLGGVAYFSFIMGSFIGIIQSFDHAGVEE
jgi:hypothetical protein